MPKKKILFYSGGFEDYTYWQTNDKTVLKKIKKLIKSIMIDGANEGIGKPEKLLGNYTGCYSRRITHEHRLVYKIEDDSICILQCRFHYKR
ncbi:Txe/YoeB family addiction module toxin [Macrococcus armenti]|uniref:Txe/YoeB family addiction module toxin n=1 Tax=Macrococcus armenti TaxID=2875764 RepID=UPI001CCE944F|nr:Txe/YoeB family addiction module toxin [Macrococcus armenti]UBH14314.1 Txe/YoeB family addiction module toxin [Macrococcus armenti]UBH16674.1 Txe/YoeB family addiction module toxin [Macrococcus armenti]UBH21105.1 Txe/YoeB family addiction module toxin [Macrococcus armenti]